MKVLFIVSDFDMGGITSSLRNLSALLLEKGHEVHILNLPKSKLPNDFNRNIKLIEIQGRARYWNASMSDVYKSKGIKKVKILFIGLIKKILNKLDKWNKFIFKKCFWSGYDVAIGFRQSPLCFYLAQEKTDAFRKVGFWHGDIDMMGDVSSWMHYSYGLDRLACVSNAVAKGVENRYPLLKGKTCTVYNVFDDNKIKQLSLVPFQEYSSEVFNIVTVARIEFEQKQLDWIPIICKKLKADGLCFRWHIVGDGPDREKLCKLIKDNQVEDVLILCGSKTNPYPYIKNARLLLLLSSWESYGMVVMESLMCNTPVVAAYYPALPEILTDGDTGLIAENSVDGVYRAVKRAMQDDILYNHLKVNCLKYEYDREIPWRQFIGLVND